jgi:hypothetical protein
LTDLKSTTTTILSEVTDPESVHMYWNKIKEAYDYGVELRKKGDKLLE